MQLKVTVNRLNKRTRIPMRLPEPTGIIGQVLQGYTFEGVEVSSSEIINPALGNWYVDRDGYYYWGGGVMGMPGIEEAIIAPALKAIPKGIGIGGAIQFDPNKMSWGHQFYDIPFIWQDLGTMGKGVTVAVIDTGVDITHDDLVSNILPLSKSFVGNEQDFSDSAGHGTNMAGIISASGNKVFGVAPQSKLVIVKATQQLNGVDLKIFARAIEYAASIPEVDIISTSYSFLDDDPDIRAAIQMCLDANKIIVAAIGNRRNNTKPTDDNTYPACYNSGVPENKGVIAIGAFDKNGQLCSFSNWNSHISMLSPGDFTILTTGIGNTTTNGSLTSIATAFTSGCLALMVSYLKVNNPTHISTCIKAVLDTCDDIGPIVGFDVRSGYGCMNLRNAIAKIKII